MACSDEPDMISVSDCRQRILDAVPSPGSGMAESVPLHQGIHRVLAEDIIAVMDVPPDDNSAMDGYALHADDLHGCATVALRGTAWAGQPFEGTIGPGECIRIMTGGVIPAGTSAVVMQEDTVEQDGGVRLSRALSAGENIRHRGEDIHRDTLLLHQGRRLNAADLGLLASQGVDAVRAFKRLRVAVLSTGDELVPPGMALTSGKIYDSNRVMLAAALASFGFDVLDLGAVADNPRALEDALERAAGQADVIITSGGVSVGEADYTRGVLGALGEVRIWKVAIKPGKPFAFGTLQNSMFFGLPGNPVSALVTLYQLALPALLKMQGVQWSAPLQLRAMLTAPVRKKPGRADYQRGMLAHDENGDLQVTPLPNQGSAVLTTMSRANCFIVLEEHQGSLAAGAQVLVEPFGPPLI